VSHSAFLQVRRAEAARSGRGAISLAPGTRLDSAAEAA
jgi:hypothetical protein